MPSDAQRRRAAPRLGRPLAALLVSAALGYFLVLQFRPAATAVAEDESQADEHAPVPAAVLAPAEVRPSAQADVADEESDTPVRRGRRMHPRDPQEWQGMLVNLDHQAFCSVEHPCGLAMACLDGRCGPCEMSSDCRDGEVCVLDHCVRSEHSECESRGDCREGKLCVLSGYSGGDTRNNAQMRSFCLAGKGGRAQQPGEHAAAIGPPPEAKAATLPPSTVDVSALQREVRERILAEEQAHGEGQEN